MTLEALGYNVDLEKHRQENGLDSFEVGRVISEHKDRYHVRTAEATLDAELLGNLRFTAESRHDFPAVGDWVALSPYDEDKALIHAIYPRHSVIERQAVGKATQKQIIATNIDCGLIVQAVDRDFNLNRLERYLTICNASKIKSVVILTKIDLLDEVALKDIITKARERIKEVPIITVSNQTENGYGGLEAIIKKGMTYCLLGSSGVGKSTLLNSISGKPQMETGAISTSVNKGRHVTSHRELVILKNGGILIDNPGMREVGIAEATGGLESTFDSILSLSQNCKFKDCSHVNEAGCAVIEALESGVLDQDTYKNYHKLEREQSRFETSIDEKRKKEKGFGKLMKSVKEARKNSKY